MLIAITGTPGVGKTTVCDLLAKEFDVINVNEFAEENGCFEDFDPDAGSYNVDTDRLCELLQSHRNEKTIFMDGHLSHYVDCDAIIVLRCDPHILSKRLELRGYDKEKVRENVQAEILDVILSEAVEYNGNTFEIDCSDLNENDVVNIIKDIIIKGKGNDFVPGKVDWTGDVEEWF